MAGELRYAVAHVGVGWVGVMGSARGLRRLTLPQSSAEEAPRLLGESVNLAIPSPGLFDELLQRLRLYFSGHRVTFSDKLDLSGSSVFQRQVWREVRLIPYGETRSYRWVAEQIRQPQAMRAVGQALGRNPLPIIIPCHRVAATGDRLGGYRGGLAMKKYLLHLEESVGAGLSPTR